MDGSPGTAPVPLDRAITAEISAIERDNTRGVVDSMPTEWTDEKHSLYLNSIEASFVNQLYSSEYQPKDLFGWLSRAQKHTNSPRSNANSLFCGQFNVMRRGCWEKLKFDKARSRGNIENESRHLCANPWIQHFRSPSKCKELHLTSLDRHDNKELARQANHLGSQSHGIVDSKEGTSLKQLPPRCSHLFRQDSVGSSTEVSDQNFVDKDSKGGEALTRTCRKRRVRTTAANALVKDQVVPSEKSTTAPSPDKYCACLEGKDAECRSSKSENITGFLPVEPDPSLFKDQEVNSVGLNTVKFA